MNPADYSCNRITSRYFFPHSFKEMKTKLSKDETISTFSVFRSNVVSFNRNLENLQTQLLHEVDFHFNVIGVTETKITNANSQMCTAHIRGYVFEYVPSPLASGGVGMFIDESLDYCILEKTSNEAFQVMWAEFSFVNKKKVICGRTQTTQIGSLISKRKNTTCGVLQGSVLSPLLFLIYVNDIQESSDKLNFFYLLTTRMPYMLTKISSPLSRL